MANPTIAFESVAAPGATPIAYNAASAKSFANNYFKATERNISQQDRKEIRIIGLIAELKANGGADYSANHAGLRQDSMVYTGGISNFDLEVAECVNDWNAGKVADATVSSDIPTLIAAGPRIDRTDAQTQDRMIAFLQAQIRK